MKNFKKVITYLTICSLVLVSILSFSTVKSKALGSGEEKDKLWLSNFEKVVSIPVSEKGIEYVSDMTGTGGPDAFDIKGDKVYIVDNAHHRILIYNKISGEFIEEVKFPESIIWVSNISVDGKGNLYLLGGSYNGNCLVTITNGKIRISSLPDTQQKGSCITISGFGSDESGPYVVYADLKETRTLKFGNGTGKTSNLDAGKPESAIVVEEKKGSLEHDKAVWKLNIQGMKRLGGQVSTSNGEVVNVEFPARYQLGTNSYIGTIDNLVYWKLEDGKSYAIVGYDKKTGKLEKAIEIPLDVYSVIPKKGFLICEKNVYILIPSQESVYVLKVVSWQSADEFMKEIEKNDSISVNSSEKLNEQTKSQVSIDGDIVVVTSVVTVPRSQMISTAQSYQWHQWYCSKVNYDGSNLSASNRQYWQRPRFITNYNANYYQVPYCWGGFSSLSGFDNEIQQGYAAGNVNTNAPGYIGGTTGVDCSGFVSRCWGLSRHYHTSEFQQIAKKLNSYYELQQGDILLKLNNNDSGHVRLFYTSNSSGQFVVYGSTISIINGNYTDRVISMGYTFNELVSNGYQPYAPY